MKYGAFDLTATREPPRPAAINGPVMSFTGRSFRRTFFCFAAYLGVWYLILVPIIVREHNGQTSGIGFFPGMLVHPVEAARRTFPPPMVAVVNRWALCLMPGQWDDARRRWKEFHELMFGEP